MLPAPPAKLWNVQKKVSFHQEVVLGHGVVWTRGGGWYQEMENFGSPGILGDAWQGKMVVAQRPWLGAMILES